MVGEISYGGAALAGLAAFFTPCILPMVPFYLSYLAGISMEDVQRDRRIVPGARRRLAVAASLFALGVTTIFALLGLGATALGRFFADWHGVLSYAAAAIIFVFGLHFLGVLRLPVLMREVRFRSPLDPATGLGAYVMGLAFGFGWTACVGPVLTSILFIASMKETLWQGGALLVVFGLGMTAPFVVAALVSGPFLRLVARHRGLIPVMEKALGAMLIVFAVLIATGSVNAISSWMIETFPAFRALG